MNNRIREKIKKIPNSQEIFKYIKSLETENQRLKEKIVSKEKMCNRLILEIPKVRKLSEFYEKKYYELDDIFYKVMNEFVDRCNNTKCNDCHLTEEDCPVQGNGNNCEVWKEWYFKKYENR